MKTLALALLAPLLFSSCTGLTLDVTTDENGNIIAKPTIIITHQK